MTSTTDQATTSTGWRADGEANRYTILRRRPANEVSPEKTDWLASVLVNGELSAQQQEVVVGRMAAAISAPVGVEEMQRRLDREESDHGRTIDQRDAAENALGHMFQAVTGRPAEWSSAWGYTDAIEEVEEHVAALAQQPPAEAQAQGGGEVVYQIENDPEEWFDVDRAMYEGHDGSRKRTLYTTPPSAPETEESIAADSYHYLTELLQSLIHDDEIPADIRDRIKAHLGLATAASYTSDLPF